MDGLITGENDERVGISVIDNNDVEHVIEMEFDGEIKHHQCEAYADNPDHRTDEENEHNNQARRFAKYHVFRERGYDTVDHIDNPEYVDAARRAITKLSDEEFEELFGALHTQLRSHHEDIDSPRDLPAGVRKPDAVVYKLDLYLGVDIDDSDLNSEAEALAEAHGLDYEAGTTTQSGGAVSADDAADWADFGEHLTDLADPENLELEISAVSGIHVGFPNASGEHEVDWAEQPLDREPDARLELMPAEPGSLDEFRAYLDHHLRCQVRDCFVGMGLWPAEPFQVVGYGKFIYARRYDHYDLYPQLHRRDGDHNAVLQ